MISGPRNTRRPAGHLIFRIVAGIFAMAGLSFAETSATTDRSPWGMASSFEWSGEYPRFNPLLENAGVTWFRYFPDWSQVQRKKDEWNWDIADALTADLKKHNLRQLGILAYAAPWATTDGSTRTMPLKDNLDWARYTEEAIRRYGKDIRYWEIWNEFNSDVFAHAPSDRKPKIYADLIKSSYVAARKTDPGVKLGLPMANFDLAFLDATIKQGAAGHFDFISVHPYENLATAVHDGGEMGYLSLAGSLRKMLKDNGQNETMPLWITEIGIQSSVQPDPRKDAIQADALVMCYILSLAQGFEKVFWFEARGPSYGKGTDYGMIRQDWSLRPVYHAYQSMTALLGPEPEYLGWLNPGGGGLGFVFSGKSGPVLISWAPQGSNAIETSFSEPVKITTVLGKASTLPQGQKLPITRSPIYISDLPTSWIEEAKSNKSLPFPWGKDHSKETTARLFPGALNREDGIRQLNVESHSEVVHGLDWSVRKSRNLQGGDQHYLYFRTDPTFAGYGDSHLEITIEVRRQIPDQPVTLKLGYEATGAYTAKKESFSIPAGDQWVEHTWTLDDANFVGGWGWNFRLDASGSSGEYQIREVRVQKLKK